MNTEGSARCIAFEGPRALAAGSLAEVALEVKKATEAGEPAPILIFDFVSSQPIELDLRGTPEEILRRLPPEEPSPEPEPKPQPEPKRRGPGRPKLGVVSREVTLLPRHWDWLAGQPGGASVTLRKLVETARRASGRKDRLRRAQDAAYRFLSAMAGNLPGFEEATRALFAGEAATFRSLTEAWPVDIRDHGRRLAGTVFQAADDAGSGSRTASTGEGS